MTRGRSRLLLAALALAAPACRRPLADVPQIRIAAPPARVGSGILARGEPRGDAVLFPPAAAGGAGILWSSRTGAATPELNTNYVERGPDGSLLSLVAKDPLRAFQLQESGGSRRLFAAIGGAAPAAVSPEGEQALGFECWERDGAGGIVWLAKNADETPVRFVRFDGSALGRASRIPFDANRPLLESPHAAPLGLPRDGALVVTFAAAARAESPREVRVVRVSRGDDGIVHASPPNLAAPGFQWSRAPRVCAASGGGILAFEGLALAEEEPAIFVATLNSAGDPIGAPRRVIALRDGKVVRSHPLPLAVRGAWYVAFEERDGETGEPSVFVQPLALD